MNPEPTIRTAGDIGHGTKYAFAEVVSVQRRTVAVDSADEPQPFLAVVIFLRNEVLLHKHANDSARFRGQSDDHE